MGKKIMSVVCILGAVFCFAYCAMVFMIRSGGKFYLVWAAAGICLVMLAGMLYFGLWDRIPILLRRVFMILAMVVREFFGIVKDFLYGNF